jgi:hypothetical protein
MDLLTNHNLTELVSYLDPGTGSLIVQGAIALVLGIGVTAKTYWGHIRGWFSKLSTPAEPADIDEA